jgi:hypothetical protein
MNWRTGAAVGVSIVLGLSGCVADEPGFRVVGNDASDITSTIDDAEVADILAELEAEGFCDPNDVEGTGDVGDVTAMHFVVRGRLEPPCLGEDPRLIEAWDALAEITPPDFLDDVSLLAGYDACSGCDTLAFVSALDDAGSFFLLAVDLTAGEDDPDELALTLQHELSHVFTQDPSTQLDVGTDAGACPTFHNGTGCFTSDSYMWAWIDQFWNLDDLTRLSEDDGTDPEGGEARCSVDPSYTGSYGASSPEEDFAEVFAAYVFDVDVGPGLDDKLAFFDRYPELQQVRASAAAAGMTGLPNTFEGCG